MDTDKSGCVCRVAHRPDESASPTQSVFICVHLWFQLLRLGSVPRPATSPACVKTPDRGIESKNRPPNFGYDALFRTARVPTTLFSLFQNAILEFLHKLSRSQLHQTHARLPRAVPFDTDY